MMKNKIYSFNMILFLVSLPVIVGIQHFDNNLPSYHNGLAGYIFIDINEIYFRGGEFWIVSDAQDTLLSIKDKNITINNQTYDLIEEDYLYRSKIGVRSFDPEYGLFVLKCISSQDDRYQVELNGQSQFIEYDRFGDLVVFKGVEQYILDSFPIPTIENPVRLQPSNSSHVVPNFDDLTFIPVDIKGEWLEVKDDKQCYKGSETSEYDVHGWIRWRKDDQFILKVTYKC